MEGIATEDTITHMKVNKEEEEEPYEEILQLCYSCDKMSFKMDSKSYTSKLH